MQKNTSMNKSMYVWVCHLETQDYFCIVTYNCDYSWYLNRENKGWVCDKLYKMKPEAIWQKFVKENLKHEAMCERHCLKRQMGKERLKTKRKESIDFLHFQTFTRLL